MATGCSKCNGTGKALEYQMVEQSCVNCGGSGAVTMPADPLRTRVRRAHNSAHDTIICCPACQGRGRVPTRTLVVVNCGACQGKGLIWSRVPVPDGRLRRRGPADPAGGPRDPSPVVPPMGGLETTRRDGQGRVERPAPQSIGPWTLR